MWYIWNIYYHNELNYKVNSMQSSAKKALGPCWQDVGIARITDHAPAGSLSWLYPVYEFQNGWYICNQISTLNMCSHLKKIYPRVPDEITDPTVPISSSCIGLFPPPPPPPKDGREPITQMAGLLGPLLVIIWALKYMAYEMKIKSIFSGELTDSVNSHSMTKTFIILYKHDNHVICLFI